MTFGHAFFGQENQQESPRHGTYLVRQIFDDFEARSNFVGLFDLALKVAKRNPKLWAEINGQDTQNYD